MNISAADKNFSVPTNLARKDLVYKKMTDTPFSLHGLICDNGIFCRIPLGVAEKTSEGVSYLNKCSAGGRIRFKTNSPYVAVYVKYSLIDKMPHFALTGSSGLDLFADGHYRGTFVPPFDVRDSYESVIDFESSELRAVTINFPTYAGVEMVYIGLKENCEVLAPDEYKYSKKVVFYGSSITEGGCSSRPSCAYEQILSHRLDFDYINLGFSGNAKAEKTISDYISNLEMSVFVYDYDHNAPDVEHLKNTHERMFLELRKKQPDLPVLMLTRPKRYLTADEIERLNVVKTTYDNAVARGDKNVYFIPGNELISEKDADFALVDNCHPSDTGFMNMADRIEPLLRRILEKGEIND